MSPRPVSALVPNSTSRTICR
uniref:Uncharacterized protein n=1 Tax=Rhizophora mucronata TaxID=61149 RepID=A0A2P2QEV6_RHIMU